MSARRETEKENVLKPQDVVAHLWINSLGVKKCKSYTFTNSLESKEIVT